MSGIVPSGSKLTTYDPHHPEWAGESAALDQQNRRNVVGLLIERGAKTADKQLIVLHGDDVGEQTAHKILRYIVDELLSGSALATQLLRKFSFLVFPVFAHQGARDGFSRFPYDCNPPGFEGNLAANGGSEIGDYAMQAAVERWCSDHPTPSTAVFCTGAFHCDVVNRHLTGGTITGDPTTPTAPYGDIIFPGHASDGDGGVSVFLNGTGAPGFAATAWPEYLKPANIGHNPWTPNVGHGSTSFYFENPWRHAGNKASFFYRQDALKNFATSFLAGVNVAAGSAIIPLDGVTVGAGFGLTASLSRRVNLGDAAISAGMGVTASLTPRRQTAATVGVGLGVTASLTRRAQLTATVGAGLGVEAVLRKQNASWKVDAHVGLGAGLTVAMRKRIRMEQPPVEVGVAFGLAASVSKRLPRVIPSATLAAGLGVQASLSVQGRRPPRGADTDLWARTIPAYVSATVRPVGPVAVTHPVNLEASHGD